MGVGTGECKGNVGGKWGFNEMSWCIFWLLIIWAGRWGIGSMFCDGGGVEYFVLVAGVEEACFVLVAGVFAFPLVTVVVFLWSGWIFFPLFFLSHLI